MYKKNLSNFIHKIDIASCLLKNFIHLKWECQITKCRINERELTVPWSCVCAVDEGQQQCWYHRWSVWCSPRPASCGPGPPGSHWGEYWTEPSYWRTWHRTWTPHLYFSLHLSGCWQSEVAVGSPYSGSIQNYREGTQYLQAYCSMALRKNNPTKVKD